MVVRGSKGHRHPRQVILNGDGPIQVTSDEKGIETEVPPKTAQALLQRQRKRKAKSILLLAIPDEYQLRFHGIKDAKTLWAAIKSRFGGNVESKKMQKTVLKQQFEKFSVSDTEGLDKAYDRALPSSWNNVALIMRNKDGIDDLDIDDLYNNLKVFEADIKGSSGSSLNSQNVAFLSTEDTSSSNEVNTANSVSTASGHNSQGQASSSSYTDDLMFSFFANQSNSPQLDDEDLEQIDHDDLEEMDLKWQVAMLSMRVKQFYKKTGRKLIFNGKEPVGTDKSKITRKQSKSSKHGHENQKSTKRSQRSKAEARKVKPQYIKLRIKRLARQKEEEVNIALIKSWDNTQAMMEADFELAQRLQTEEQGEITIGERSRLFVELMDRRKKHFAKLRAEEIRRNPPTKAQKRNQMSTYLKNMAGYKHSQLKSKSYNEIQKLFDKEMKRVNTFLDMNSEVVKGSETRIEESSKRVGDELESDMSKKQKIDEHVEDDQDEVEMKRHIKIVKDDEVAIDAIPLSTKPPVIVEYKIDKDGRMGYFKLIRADGPHGRHRTMPNCYKHPFEGIGRLL
ncbi:hypothetical protein Tco_0751000 [Tanacetum coccineum]|uniref:Uncharacterized protein n=1 Tax=Tanacetum coccineum TaxID=301880 RepID=A0ABQ4Z2U4_9ASTR